MTFHDTMERVVQGFEVAGVAILVVGSLLAFVSAALRLRDGEGRAAYQRARQGVGRAILLGLEVLIIADIVLTITVDRKVELEGTLPWRRGSTGRRPDAAVSVGDGPG